MKNTLKKRGQVLAKKFSKFSKKAEAKSKERIKENFIERLSHIKQVRLLILEWSLLIFILILLAITQSIWFGNSYSVNSYTTGGTYTEATLGKVNSLNPLFASTNSEKALSRLLFATLVTTDFSGNPGNGLAESIVSTENGQTWTLKLRENLKWSDGEPITNEDVVFTINLIKNQNVTSVYSSNLSGVSVSEGENGEIIFTLPSAYADFKTALNIPILPKHILADVNPKTLVEHSFSTEPVTSGAFSYTGLQNIGTEGEKIIYLAANPFYYKGEPMLSSFAIHAFIDKDDIISAVNSGSITATSELLPSDSVKITNSNFNEKQSLLSTGVYAFMNTSSSVFKNKSLRQAVQQGINLSKIRAIASTEQALDYPLVSTQIDIKNYPTLPEYSPESAKSKVYDYVGETNANPEINIAAVNSGYIPEVAEVLAEELENIGFQTHLTVYDENQEFISSVIGNRSYDILIYSIELGSDPDQTAYYHSSQASTSGLNFSNYKNTIVDDILLSARETTDEETRIKKYESFLEYWVNDAPAVGLYQTNMSYFYNKNVRTFSNDNRLVTSFDRFTDVQDWAVNKSQKNRTP